MPVLLCFGNYGPFIVQQYRQNPLRPHADGQHWRTRNLSIWVQIIRNPLAWIHVGATRLKLSSQWCTIFLSNFHRHFWVISVRVHKIRNSLKANDFHMLILEWVQVGYANSLHWLNTSWFENNFSMLDNRWCTCRNWQNCDGWQVEAHSSWSSFLHFWEWTKIYHNS